MIPKTWRISRLIDNAVKLKKYPSDIIPIDQTKSEDNSAFAYVFMGTFLYPENMRVNHPIPRRKNREIKIDQNGFLLKFGKK